MERDKASERPFGKTKGEDTITSAIPTRIGEPDDAPMPDPASKVEPYERAQVPTQRSDIVRSDR